MKYVKKKICEIQLPLKILLEETLKEMIKMNEIQGKTYFKIFGKKC